MRLPLSAAVAAARLRTRSSPALALMLWMLLGWMLCLTPGGSARAAAAAADGQEPIRVGIMHSLSGTMAISEAALKDVMLMLIEDQNRRGGLLGRRLEPVVVDPASSNPLFVENTRRLLLEERVAVIFGCWTSASRKAVLPVLEEHNGLLFYPVQSEGEEASRNIIYTGATPVQQALPAVDYLVDRLGVECMVLSGTDYVFPRTINKIIRNYLIDTKHFKSQDIKIYYTPFSYEDWHPILDEIRDFVCHDKKAAIVSSLNGDTNIHFYRALDEHRMCEHELTVMDFSVGEEEMAAIGTGYHSGHLSAWNYFMSLDTPQNREFIAALRSFTGNPQHMVSDPMEAHYIGFRMWVQAVEKAGTTDVSQVLEALIGQETENLSGSRARLLPNHHITKPVYVGEYQADQQYKIVWRSKGLVDGEAWSPFIPESRFLKADWLHLRCGRYNTQTGRCLDGTDTPQAASRPGGLR